MALSLNTNLFALSTQRRLGESTTKLTKSFERLSSGLRINRAGDDAAGLAISEALRTDSRVFTQAIRNLNDGVSITNIGESTLNEMTNIVTRVQELAEQAANGTLSSRQRASLDAEAQALAKEYFRISRVAEFNGMRLFDGTIQQFRFQAGYGETGSIASNLGGKLGTGTVSGTVTYAMDIGYTLAATMSDLNADGLSDLISVGTTDGGDGGATIRLANADGTFGAAGRYVMETWVSTAVTIGDVNGDNIQDLVSAGYADGPLGMTTIRLGRGDGTFGAATSYRTEDTRSNGVALGDLNNDGLLDLVTAGMSAAGGVVSVRFGAGDGTFGQTTSYLAETTESHALTLADLNSDGLLDLITAGRAPGGYATIRLGAANGTFGAATSYTTETSGSSAVAVNDLNGDGVLDLITAGTAGADGSATVRLGRGDGTFGAATSYAAESGRSLSVALGDLNGDGAVDLITAGHTDAVNDSYITTWMGRGDGQFTTPTSINVFQSFGAQLDRAQSVMTNDVNGDGVLDVVVAGFGLAGSMDGVSQVLIGDTREGVSPMLPFSLKTRGDALKAIPLLQQTLQRVSTQRGVIGALQSRLGTAISNLEVAREHYDGARSQISDVDVANESAELLRAQILQKTASAILTQANQAPALALNLLKN